VDPLAVVARNQSLEQCAKRCSASHCVSFEWTMVENRCLLLKGQCEQLGWGPDVYAFASPHGIGSISPRTAHHGNRLGLQLARFAAGPCAKGPCAAKCKTAVVLAFGRDADVVGSPVNSTLSELFGFVTASRTGTDPSAAMQAVAAAARALGTCDALSIPADNELWGLVQDPQLASVSAGAQMEQEFPEGVAVEAHWALRAAAEAGVVPVLVMAIVATGMTCFATAAAVALEGPMFAGIFIAAAYVVVSTLHAFAQHEAGTGDPLLAALAAQIIRIGLVLVACKLRGNLLVSLLPPQWTGLQSAIPYLLPAALQTAHDTLIVASLGLMSPLVYQLGLTLHIVLMAPLRQWGLGKPQGRPRWIAAGFLAWGVGLQAFGIHQATPSHANHILILMSLQVIVAIVASIREDVGCESNLEECGAFSHRDFIVHIIGALLSILALCLPLPGLPGPSRLSSLSSWGVLAGSPVSAVALMALGLLGPLTSRLPGHLPQSAQKACLLFIVCLCAAGETAAPFLPWGSVAGADVASPSALVLACVGLAIHALSGRLRGFFGDGKKGRSWVLFSRGDPDPQHFQAHSAGRKGWWNMAEGNMKQPARPDVRL